MSAVNIIPEEERFDMITGALGLTAYKLSDELNYPTKNTVYRIKSGRGKINNEEFARRLVRKFPNVSYEFIMQGKLPVLLDPQQQIIQSNFIESEEISEFKELMPEQKIEMIMDELLMLRQEIKNLTNLIKLKQ